MQVEFARHWVANKQQTFVIGQGNMDFSSGTAHKLTASYQGLGPGGAFHDDGQPEVSKPDRKLQRLASLLRNGLGTAAEEASTGGPEAWKRKLAWGN